MATAGLVRRFLLTVGLVLGVALGASRTAHPPARAAVSESSSTYATRAESQPSTLDGTARDELLELARSIGSAGTRVDALEWARAGVAVWRRDLQRGIIPGSVPDAETTASAAVTTEAVRVAMRVGGAPAGIAPLRQSGSTSSLPADGLARDGGAASSLLDIWPGEPLLSEYRALAEELELPLLCSRHSALTDAILRSLVRLAAEYHARLAGGGAAGAEAWEPVAARAGLGRASARAAGGREEEGREGEEDDATGRARAAAAAVGAAARERWRDALRGVKALDEALDGRIPPGLLPLADDDEAAGSARAAASAAAAPDDDDNSASGGSNGNGDGAAGSDEGGARTGEGGGLALGQPRATPAPPAATAGVGPSSGVWRHSGWIQLASLQRRVDSLPGLRELLAKIGRRASETGKRRGRLPRQLPARPPAADGVARAQAGAPPAEAGGLVRSADLSRALPAEMSLLALSGPRAAGARRLFRARLAERALATVSLEGWTAMPARPPRPRAAGRTGAPPAQRRPPPTQLTPLADGGGPIIVCLDTSASMEGGGPREALAKATVLAAARAAAREGRAVRCIAFGSAREVADSGELLLLGGRQRSPGGPGGPGSGARGGGGAGALGGAGGTRPEPAMRALLELLGCAFGGGTDVVGALAVALSVLEAPPDEAAPAGEARARAGIGGDGRANAGGGGGSARRRAGLARRPATLAPADLILVTDGELPDPPADRQTLARVERLRAERGVRVHCLLVCGEAEAPARMRRMEALCGDGADGGGVHGLLCAEGAVAWRHGSAARPRTASLARAAAGDSGGGGGSSSGGVSVAARPAAPAAAAAGGADPQNADAAALAWLRLAGPSLAALRASLHAGLQEREHEAAMLALCALCGEHVLLIGPPGTAKSALARRLADVCGGVRFEALLSKFTPPEELFGPLSLAALERDQYARAVAGFLPTATIAFLDEIFKANAAVLNSLLAILNERLFHGGVVGADGAPSADGPAAQGTPAVSAAVRGSVRVPLLTCIGASNELPESEELGALYDRFLVRLEVRPLSDGGLRALLGAAPPPGAAQPPASQPARQAAEVADGAPLPGAVPPPLLLRQVRAVLALAPPLPAATATTAVLPRLASLEAAVSLPSHAAELMIQLRDHCEREWGPAARPSDRRLAQSARLLRVSAATHGRALVSPLDCLLLAHTLCPEPALAPELATFVRARAAPDPPTGTLRLVLSSAVDAADAALRQSGGELSAARGVAQPVAERLAALRGDAAALRRAAEAEGAALDACAAELGLPLAFAAVAAPPPAGAAARGSSAGGGGAAAQPEGHLWLSAEEQAAAVLELRPKVRARQAALAEVCALAARTEALLSEAALTAPASGLAGGSAAESAAAATAAIARYETRRASWRLEEVAALADALDDGGGSAAGRALRAASGALGAGASAGADGAQPAAVEFSDDELRMGVKEAKAALRSPALFRAWKKAKRAAAGEWDEQ